MNTAYYFYQFTGSIFLFLFWTAWWFQLLLALAVAAAAFIFHLVKIKKLKHEKADIERQLLERNELLLYARKNEQKAQEKALLADKSKMALLSKINHEIRTPMNGVLGMATLLDQTELTAEQKEYTDTILSSGHSLIGVVNEIMINDILEYSKIDSGKELEAKEFDLSACIEEVFDVFAAKAASSNIDLLYSIQSNVPVFIIGDVRRLRQVLTNLVENALKFSYKGQVFIGVALRDCKEDNGIKLQFVVSDSGMGMSPEKMGELSAVFSKPGSSAQSVTKGAGLIICHKLVSLMGGSIRVDSNEWNGTSFEFTITTKTGMQQQERGNKIDAGSLEGKKILVVDNNNYAGEVLRKYLEQLKMVAEVETSGTDALEMLTQATFDMVLLNADTSDVSCIALTRSIREKYPVLPVTLLKWPIDEKYKEHASLFNHIINKPVKRQALLDVLFTQFRHHGLSVAHKQNKIHKLSKEFSIDYPLTILVAEDNLVNQRWVTKILTKLGYEADVVNNGKEVLEVVSSKQYDLILMDVQMPEMDGMEATRMIRLCLAAQPVVIAMTANVMQGDKQDCLQSGMNDYISKPVELNDLVEMLEKWGIFINEKKRSA